MSDDKCTPQFIFEMAAAQVTHLFLNGVEQAQEIIDRISLGLLEHYDDTSLAEDLKSTVERMMTFIGSVEISDVDLILLSFIYFRANFEDGHTKRNKKPLFGGLLKPRPKESSRSYFAAKSFMSYTYAVGAGAAPIKPESWTPAEEIELEPIMKILFPPPPPEEATGEPAL
jgi:hypothetical protein